MRSEAAQIGKQVRGARALGFPRVAGTDGHAQRKVGQPLGHPRGPGPRSAAGERAHAAVLEPRVGEDRRRSFVLENGYPSNKTVGAATPGGEERAKRSERLRDGPV
jgi:hypothetical protein